MLAGRLSRAPEGMVAVHELNDEDIGEALASLRAAPPRAVLVIESDPDRQQRLARLLKLGGHRVIGTGTVDAARSLLREFAVDLVLVTEELTLPKPMALIADLISLRPSSRFVVLTEHEEPTSGMRPARYEALEYMERPLEPAGLRELLAG